MLSAGPIKRIYINARFLTQQTTGVQRYAQELVRAIDKLITTGEIDPNEYDIVLLTPNREFKCNMELQNIKIRRAGFLAGHAWEQLELPVYSKDGLLFCPGNVAPVYSLVTGRKIVTTVHSLSFKYFPDAYSLAFKAVYETLIPLVLKYADTVITVSDSERELILKQYPGSERALRVIHNGGVSDSFVQMVAEVESGLAGEEPFILFVGSLSKSKNLTGVLQAVEIINKSREIHLKIVGEITKTFQDSNFTIPESIRGKVEFKGQINDTKTLVSLYKGALCLAFPSFYESSGLPVIEAMACGCPVIASDIPALKERCGDAAVYCNPVDVYDIAQKILSVIDEPLIKADLQQKGFARNRQFTWKKCALETFDVIRKLVKS